MFDSRRAPILSFLAVCALGLSACDDKPSNDDNKAATDKSAADKAEAPAEPPKVEPSKAGDPSDVADKMKALEDPFKKDDAGGEPSTEPKSPTDMKAALEDPFKKPAE
jgi:hypothetical protein